MSSSGGRASRDLALILAILAAFLIIGMPDGMAGAAWPHMRLSLDAPLGALSLLVTSAAAGFFLGTLGAGTAIGRLGARRLVCLALMASVGSSAVIACSSLLSLTVAAVFMLGACGGLIDAALSTIVALSGNARLMGFMHGTLSAGAALSPIVVASVAHLSWRWAYLVISAAQLLALGAWLVATRSNRARPGMALNVGTPEPTVEPTAGSLHAPRPTSRPVLVGLVAFLFVSGLGIAGGAWGGVFLTSVLSLSTPAVGVTLSLYWACLSLSRFAVGLVDRMPSAVWLTGGGMLALLGSVLTMTHQPFVASAGLVMIGAGAGPLFPVLSSLTPARVGRDHSGYVIGWQLAAASVGAALVPSLVGLAVSIGGPDAIGPGLVMCAALCLVFSTVARGSSAVPVRE